MIYNFDRVIDRHHSECEKWDNTMAVFGEDDVIPLWIADMDFPCAEPIIEAIHRRTQHGIFGYYMREDCYWQAVQRWVERRSGWKVECQAMVHSPGVVAGVAFAMLGNSEPGDGVMIQPPVYHPFANVIRINNRRVINNPLRLTADGYQIDFEDFERKAASSKVFILCNPHNPTGRAFTEQELRRMGEICLRHSVVIISDEIHSDFVYAPRHHIHIASLSAELAAATVTLIAPSKSFNVAGFCTAVAIITNDELREKYIDQMMRVHLDNSNICGAVALQAAYNECEDWLDQIMQYLEANIDFVLNFLHTNMPNVVCHKPEATFLLWLDFRAWGLCEDTLDDFLIHKARLGMNHGSMFGVEGTCFQRMNIGAPRATISRALNQLLAAAKAQGYV
ncbi:MAG: MalY/PatB family protein [Mucinivorans sp.]